MGVNNRQRRAAKKKRSAPRSRPSAERFHPEPTPALARSLLVELLAAIEADTSAAEVAAEALSRPDGPLPPVLAQEALQALLAEVTARVVAHGWRATDLVHTVTRRLSEASASHAVALVAAETDRHPQSRVSVRWRDDLASAGLPVPVQLGDARSVEAALRLATLLAFLPPVAVLIPPPGAAPDDAQQAGRGDPKLLARVRALLSKAESTEYDEEAEALSAKAQELISRHALERLLQEADAPGRPAAAVTSARRIWIDPPYVFAKALLVASVADANRCRSVVSEDLGFSTVIGSDDDLAAVDVLVTSLLLQSGVAMRRHGRHQDRTGTSRTRSFRQSFLVAYASRIRERLQSAADEAVQDSGRSGELVPVLHRQAEQVDAATEQLFPELQTRRASINNAQGWVAGRAAADQARLDVAESLEAAG